MANNLIVCGGTFDHFHKGHEEFLKYVFSVGKKVIIGVTSDEYVKSSKFIHSASSGQSSKSIEPFEIRMQSVLEFTKKEKALNKVKIAKINDLFGPTLSKDLLIDGIVISEGTKKGAEIINQKRKKLGLSLLKIFIVPSVNAEDRGVISSARIRGGEISRVGKLYVKPAWLKTDLVLPETLRGDFKRLFGKLVRDVESLNKTKNSLVITVGDETSKKFNEKSLGQNLSVIDFKVARKKAFSSFSDLGFSGNEKIITADNPAGHITYDLFSKVLDIFESSFDKMIILKIAGEEDLAVLPLILVAPLNTIIYYGQPSMGIVKVAVSEETKKIAYELIDRFEMLKPAITRGY